MMKLVFGPDPREGIGHRQRVLGYLHSTTAEGSDIEQLLPSISTFCSMKGFAMDEVYVDGGAMSDRPALAALIEALRARPCVGVVVTSPDQLADRPADVRLLVDRIRSTGADLITVVGGWSDKAA